MKENDIREDMNGIKSEILRDDEERKKDQLKRLQAYVEAIQKKVSSHTDEVVKELVAERHRQGLTQSDIADRTGMKASNIARLENGSGIPTLVVLEKYASVPSGNFGNCLAGWFAKNMGLPVNKFIAASNKNNILTDFFTTGKYDANREFFKTNAPAMDILVSSNLERLVWYMSGKDGDKVKEYMEKLKADGIYEVDDETFARIQDQFKAGYLNEEEVLKTIKDCYEDNGYVLDTHTACGYGVLKQYQKETGDQTKTILLSTASPYKFPESVYKALFNEELNVYDAIEKLNKKTGVAVPKPLVGIKDREVLHKTHIDKTEIINFIKSEMEGL